MQCGLRPHLNDLIKATKRHTARQFVRIFSRQRRLCFRSSRDGIFLPDVFFYLFAQGRRTIENLGDRYSKPRWPSHYINKNVMLVNTSQRNAKQCNACTLNQPDNHHSTTQLTTQPINQPLNHEPSCSTKHSLTRPTAHQLTNRPIGKSTTQPTTQPDNQPLNPAVNPSTRQ